MPMNLGLLLPLLVGAFASPAPSAPLEPRPSLRITSWDTAAGLPQNAILALAQTRDGFLWAATSSGLVRFDGFQFQVFNKQNTPAMASSYVGALAASPDGSLWFGIVGGGVGQWRNGQIRVWRAADGLSSEVISSVAVDEAGRVWAGSNKGLDVYENNRWSPVGRKEGLAGMVPFLAAGPGAGVWACIQSKLVHWQDGKLSLLGAAEGLPAEALTTVFVDQDRSIWVASETGKVLHQVEGRFVAIDTSQWSGNRIVQTFARDQAGTLWMGSFGGGLAQWTGTALRVLEEKDGWNSRTVYSLLKDRDGQMWAGSITGLSRLRNHLFVALTKADGLRGSLVRAIYQDSAGQIWIGSDAAMHRVEAGLLKPLPDASPQPPAFLSAVQSSAGMLFGTARTGMLQATPGGFRPAGLPAKFEKAFVGALYQARDGRIWVGTNAAGVMVFDQGKLVESIGAAQGFPLANIRSITQAADSTYWIGSFSGLAQSTPGGWKTYSTKDGLPSDIVMSLHEDSAHTVWVGTSDGLCYFAQGRLIPLGAKEGFPVASIFSILEDETQDLWFGTSVGIVRVMRADLTRVMKDRSAKASPIIYGREAGMPVAQCSGGTQNVACRLKNNDLLFGTPEGVVCVRPSSLPLNKMAPKAWIESARVDGQPVAPGKLIIPAGSRTTEIEFTAPSLVFPEKAAFRYRMRGFDDNWVESGNRRIAFYTNLPHGTYSFEVEARNEDGIWSASPAQLEVQAKPFFWQTMEFTIAAVVGLVALGVVLYRLRLRHLRQQFQLVLDERTRIARELHDTMVQGYVGITAQLEAVAQELETAPSLAALHLNMARRMSQHSLTEARRAVTDLRSDQGPRPSFPQALEHALAPIIARFPVEVSMDVSPHIPKLDQQVEHQLIRITQEALTNALQHSKATSATVTAHVVEGRLQMTVTDTGTGFDASRAFSTMDGHFGLIGMRERANLIQAQFEVVSSPGQGTRIVISIPLGPAC